jgi:hypothetical protein
MTLDIQNLTVHPRNPRAGYTVILRVTGAAEEVRTWISRYMAEFPPEGYGTWTSEREDLPNGHLRVLVHRGSSCD